MDFEEMKSSWNELNNRTANSETGNKELMDYIWMNNVRSARERLLFQYRRFVFIGSIMAIVMTFTRGEFFPWYIKISFIGYFLLVAAMDYYLYRGIKGIDVNTFTVNDVARKALFYRRRHHLFQLILLPIAVLMLSAQFFIASETFRWGMLCGLIMGLVVGISIYVGIMRNYKSLISQ